MCTVRIQILSCLRHCRARISGHEAAAYRSPRRRACLVELVLVQRVRGRVPTNCRQGKNLMGGYHLILSHVSVNSRHELDSPPVRSRSSYSMANGRSTPPLSSSRSPTLGPFVCLNSPMKTWHVLGVIKAMTRVSRRATLAELCVSDITTVASPQCVGIDSEACRDVAHANFEGGSRLPVEGHVEYRSMPDPSRSSPKSSMIGLISCTGCRSGNVVLLHGLWGECVRPLA